MEKVHYSTLAHIKGVLKRIRTGYKKEREEIPGCKEQINFTFFKYVITYNKRKRPEINQLLNEMPREKILIFRKQKDLNKWLKNFTHNESILKDIK